MSETIIASTAVRFTRTFQEETTLTCSSDDDGVASFSVYKPAIEPPFSRRGVAETVEVVVAAGTYEISFRPHTADYTGTIEIG